MTHICKRKCYWNGRLWQPGDTTDMGPEDAGSAAARAHFTTVGAVAPSVVEAPEVEAPVDVVPPVADPVDSDLVGAGDAPAGEEEITNARENLKHLCLRNGINIHARISNKAMRDALAAKGITVA